MSCFLVLRRPYSRKDYNYKDPYNHKDPELGLGYENLLASPGGSFASSYSGALEHCTSAAS